jgi:hypothetical protein
MRDDQDPAGMFEEPDLPGEHLVVHHVEVEIEYKFKCEEHERNIEADLSRFYRRITDLIREAAEDLPDGVAIKIVGCDCDE